MLEANAVRGRRLWLAALLCGVLWVGLILSPVAQERALASVPTGGAGEGAAYEVKTCEGESLDLTAPEYESLKLHNEARKGAGLDYLCVNPILTEAARSHAADMLERDYFSHYSPGGSGTSPIERMESAGYSGWSMWGENIAWGSGTRADASEIFGALMDSPGHRENILKDGYLEVGIGAVSGEFDGYDDAGMYAMDFGARGGQEHEYPEVLSESGGTDEGGQVPDEEPDGAVTPPDQENAVEPTPEPGESQKEDEQEATDAQAAICERFGRTRERIIGDLRDSASEANDAADGDLASRIIAETKTQIADDFEESLLNPSFCDFGSPNDPNEETTPDETTGPEQTAPEQTTSDTGESTDGEEGQKTVVVEEDGEGDAGSADAIRQRVEREARAAVSEVPSAGDN